MDITLLLSVVSIACAAYAIGLTLILKRELENTNDGLRECATKASYNKLHLDTLANQVNKPKAKRGRPRKNAPKPHVINGVQ